ncbi:MAG: hypothetical protein OIN66_14695 [Candidatus Methanoperedens sp.]|nr:hypothetical protein [Candidatus Methanoperedens sp.]
MNEDLSKSANAELKELFSIFRQLSSEGEVRRPISIKNEEGEWKSVEMTLKGRPLLMFSTTATEFDAQIQSRAFVVYPSMTSFQNSIVACFQRVENMLPATQRIPEEIAILRKAIACAIEMLKEEKIKVINPFTPALDAGISADSSNIKRDRPKIYSLVNAITLWHSRQREKYEGHVISTVLDHLYMLHIASESINGMLSGSGDENFPNLFRKISEKMKPLCKPLSDLKAKASSKEIDVRAYALKELEEKSITNDMVKDWLGVGTSSAAALTRQAAKKGMLVVDKNSKPYKYYIPAEASRIIVKTNGHVAFGCNATLQALFSPEKLCNASDGTCNEAYLKHIRHTLTLADLTDLKTPDYRLPDNHKIGDVCIRSSIWDRQLQGQSGVFTNFYYLKKQLDDALQHNATSPTSDSENHSEQIDTEVPGNFCEICNCPLKDGEGVRFLMRMVHPSCKFTPINVEVLMDIPSFVGADERTYGPLKKGEVKAIPALNALPLVNKKAAIRIQESTGNKTFFRRTAESFERECDYCGERRWLSWKDNEGNRVCDACRQEEECNGH